ncbi:MAG: hypothetical protein HY810_04655 [Candidatus Omnitrophica bacterium]|nr:hypothetical protein [Candidatus Omnitrophota bacterium]
MANSLKKYNCYVETLTVLSYALELSAGDEQVFNLIDDVFIRMADAEKHGIFIFICLINFLIKQKFIYV